MEKYSRHNDLMKNNMQSKEIRCENFYKVQATCVMKLSTGSLQIEREVKVIRPVA